MLTIKENVTILNQWPDRAGFNPKGIVIHSTWGSYNGSIAWFHNPSAGASCHYIIDINGEITKCVEERAAAWQAGVITVPKEMAPLVLRENWSTNFNLITIGVEMVDNREKNHVYPALQFSAAVELVADICRRYHIPVSRDYIVMHKETDPVNRTDPVGEWDQDNFIKEVESCVGEGGVEEKVLGQPAKIRINCTLNVRSGPAKSFRLSGCRQLNKGDKVDVVGYVEGEDVSGINTWYKSSLGNYFWTGGTDKPVLERSDLKDIMTKEIYDAKLAEFNQRKSALDARKLELDNAVVANQADLATYEAEFAAFSAEPIEETPAVPVEPVVEIPVEPVVETPVEPVATPIDVAQDAQIAEGKSLIEKLEAEVAAIKEKLGL